MIRIVSSARWERLTAGLTEAVLERERLRVQTAHLLEAQADLRAQVEYWRSRAERFLDQIGATSGIIAAPTMTEPRAGAPSDDMRSVLGALGIDTISSDAARFSSPPRPADSTAVTGVNAEAAARAVREALSDL